MKLGFRWIMNQLITSISRCKVHNNSSGSLIESRLVCVTAVRRLNLSSGLLCQVVQLCNFRVPSSRSLLIWMRTRAGAMPIAGFQSLIPIDPRPASFKDTLIKLAASFAPLNWNPRAQIYDSSSSVWPQSLFVFNFNSSLICNSNSNT